MLLMLGHSITRLFREGLKSLSVPLIVFVLVILINLLGGIRTWLEEQYEDTMDNFPIVAVVSDLTGRNTDDLRMGMRYIELFLDPDVHFSLMRYTGELSMRRTLENFNIPGQTTDITMLGITGINSDASLDPDYGAEITFFDGYDEQAFLSEEWLSVISEDLYDLVENGLLNAAVTIQMPDEVIEEPILPEDEEIIIYYSYGNDGERIPHYFIRTKIEGMEDLNWAFEDKPFFPEYIKTIIEGERVNTEMELIIIGTVTGAGYGMIYSPFWAVSVLAVELDESFIITETLNLTLSNNRELSDFKGNAGMSFSRTNPIHDSRPFAITVYDSEFYETLEPLRQNIIVIDVATPFIYILSIAVGFLTSVLLTRRRKAEFAIMRSIGVNKWVVFSSALAEQTLLCSVGAALGFSFVAIIWGYMSITRPAVFLACYLIGAIFAALSAASTNVMKVLRDRNE